MVDLDLQIKSVQEKLQQLLKQQSILQRENQRLQKELEKAGLQNQEKQTVMQSLQQQMDVAKLGTDNLTEEEKKALSKRIDGYLKEIDKCFALLNT